jgi:hypothetical protein
MGFQESRSCFARPEFWSASWSSFSSLSSATTHSFSSSGQDTSQTRPPIRFVSFKFLLYHRQEWILGPAILSPSLVSHLTVWLSPRPLAPISQIIWPLNAWSSKIWEPLIIWDNFSGTPVPNVFKCCTQFLHVF